MAIDKCVASGLDGRVMMRRLRMLSLSPLALVAACGGGGSDVASTPPPPTGPSYQKLADITASSTLATLATTYERAGDGPLTTSKTELNSIQITYDPTTQTYTVRGAPVIGSSTIVEESFGPADLEPGSRGDYNKTHAIAGELDTKRLSIGIEPLTYVNYGIWTVGRATSTDQIDGTVYFSYGMPTKIDDMPRSGSASYALQSFGQANNVTGSGSLTANFAASSVDVNLSLTGINYPPRPGGPTSTYPIATLIGSGTIGAANNPSGFTSTLAGDGYTGSINGLFYGPQAAEVGGIYSVTHSGADPIIGVVLGRRN